MRPPWYDAIEKALRPLEGHMQLALVGIAVITLVVAWKGDSVARTAWFVYLVSP